MELLLLPVFWQVLSRVCSPLPNNLYNITNFKVIKQIPKEAIHREQPCRSNMRLTHTQVTMKPYEFVLSPHNAESSIEKKSDVRQCMAECLPLSGSKLIAVCQCIDRWS